MLTTDQKGAIAEAEVAAAAIRLGVGVYRPTFEGGRGPSDPRRQGRRSYVSSASGRPDEGDVVVVRCYSCRRGRDGMIVRKYTPDEVDAIAAYCPEIDTCYISCPPASRAGEEWFTFDSLQVRTISEHGSTGPRTSTSAARLRALVGAIVQLGERLAGSQKVAGSSPAGSIPSCPRLPSPVWKGSASHETLATNGEDHAPFLRL